MKRLLRALVHRLRHWLQDASPTPQPAKPVPFDNSYDWLRASFVSLMKDPVCSRRPQYVWGALQGGAMAKVIGVPAITVLELGMWRAGRSSSSRRPGET